MIQNLYDFIDLAERNKKYLHNTARGMRTTLKIVENVITEQEKESLDLLQSHLDAVFRRMYENDPKHLSVASLGVYKRRMKALLHDYKRFGNDSTKIESWKPKKLSPKPVDNLSQKRGGEAGRVRFEVTLSSGIAHIETPADMNEEDIKKLKGYIAYLETIV